MTNDLRAIVVAYVVAAAVAFYTAIEMRPLSPIWIALWADVAATLAIFLFSLFYRNSSFYDAYWSVAPIAIALYWMLAPSTASPSAVRGLLVLVAVAVWGVRLTHNWYRGWEGLHHEDWRYLRLRRQSGRAYWLVSLAGIHMAPTLLVFLGCLPVYPALAVGEAPLSWLDALAFAVTAGAIALETRADLELLRFRREPHEAEAFLCTGLWARCRHPNYLGEMGFWWGIFLFGLAADPSWAWTIVGPLGITLLFRFVSLPMIEERMHERRPGFADWAKRSTLVLPHWRRAAGAGGDGC